MDLFSGAGGLSLGLKQAGWTPLLAVDNWPDAVETYSAHFDEPIHRESISDLTENSLREQLSDTPSWIVGGPPCQGFSTVGKRHRKDPRNFLVREYARVVNILRPEGFLIENVVGLRDMRFIGFIEALFSQIGYGVTPIVLAAADYGVPQLRRRILFIGDRERRAFIPPEPLYSDCVSVWDAIGDLPELKPGEVATAYVREPFTAYQRSLRGESQELQGHVASNHPAHLVQAISFIPDGGNRSAIPDAFQPKSGYHNSYSRLHSGSPAVAVTQNMGKPSGTRCIHPFQDRGLTAREGARLQGFPDSFHFTGGITSQRLQVANAVSPILARVIGRALIDPDSWTEAPVGAIQTTPCLEPSELASSAACATS